MVTLRRVEKPDFSVGIMRRLLHIGGRNLQCDDLWFAVAGRRIGVCRTKHLRKKAVVEVLGIDVLSNASSSVWQIGKDVFVCMVVFGWWRAFRFGLGEKQLNSLRT